MSTPTQFQDLRSDATASIAINTSLSAAVECGGCAVVGVQMPAAWDAAALTFQGSRDGSTYQNVYDAAGNEVSVTLAASRAVGFSQAVKDALRPWNYVKVRSGTAGAAVNQTAARSLGLILEPI